MATDEGNRKAQNNGEWGNKTAMQILNEKFQNPKYVNELVDYYADHGIPIEVKSCQDLIQSGNIRWPYRLGNFVLDKEQHLFLLAKQGYYLFLVKNGSLLVKAKLMKAEDLTFGKLGLNFSRLVMWKRVMGD